MIYLSEGASKKGSVTVPTDDGGTVDVDVEADIDLTTWVGGFYGGYTFNRTEATAHHFIVGVRYLSLDSDIRIQTDDPEGEPLNGRSFSVSGDVWDGVIGFQG